MKMLEIIVLKRSYLVEKHILSRSFERKFLSIRKNLFPMVNGNGCVRENSKKGGFMRFYIFKSPLGKKKE